MNTRLLIAFFISIMFIACSPGKPAEPYSPYFKTLKLREIGDQDQLVKDLYQDYEANPTTQAQKDQNIIINYLMDNKISATRLPSGVYMEIYKYGNGSRYYLGKKFSARYTGYFLNGEIFDSNIEKPDPLVMGVGEMIVGWNEAILSVTTGAKYSVIIPSHLAYGRKGIKGVIPPNTVLAFDVDLTKPLE